MKKLQPINIRVPAHFPYQDSKEVPWKYDTNISLGGKQIQFSNAEIVSIAGRCGMARSGHMYAPNYSPKVIPEPLVVHTPSPQAGASVVVPTVPVDTPSSYMSKGTSSSTTEAVTSKGKEVAKE